MWISIEWLFERVLTNRFAYIQILGFQIGSTGILAGVPHFARIFGSVAFGYIAKMLESRFPNVSLTIWRKVFAIFCKHTWI